MKNLSDYSVVDFETDGILSRPSYPPVPCGVSIKETLRAKPFYLAWGHKSGNNCTKAQARKTLLPIYKRKRVIFHNCIFDTEVGSEHLNLPMPTHFEDTLFLAFLNDPREESLSLKPLAHKHLNIPPTAQDKVKEWILNNVPQAHENRGGNNPENFWAFFFAWAPPALVGKYANTDTNMTAGIFRFMYPRIVDRGMLEAYHRELALVKVVQNMEKAGVRLDVKRLKRDVPVWEENVKKIDKAICRRLGSKFDVNKPAQLVEAMDNAGVVDEWIYTEKGNISTSRENIESVCTDKYIVDKLALRGVYSTYLSTFGRPWIERAEKADGYLYPGFHQVRSTEEYKGGGRGTRSGRFSSSNPNFQNVPSSPHDEKKKWTLELPKMRSYIIPDPGCVLLRRDYSQQELRILAHFEDGELMEKYNEEPWLDIHEFARQLIHQKTGILFDRKFIKVTAFGIVYGMGLTALGKRLEISSKEAGRLKKAYLQALPGISSISKELKQMSKDGIPLVTWGGRQYYCEPPRIIKGELRTFEYKMLNYLIQPSAADCTKQGMVNLANVWSRSPARIALQVHDELLANVPEGKANEKKYMREMTLAMEDVKFDVPMLSDGKIGRKNWGELVDFEALPKDRV